MKLPKDLSVGQFLEPLKLVALLILIFLSWMLWVQPQYNNFAAASSAKLDIESDLNNVEGEIKKIEDLSNSAKSIASADLNKINYALPATPEVEDFLSSMHKLAQSAGLTVTSIIVRPLTDKDADGSVSSGASTIASTSSNKEIGKSDLNMNMRGTYEQLIRFLNSLEHNARLVDVVSLTISSSAESDTLQVGLNAFTYHLQSIPQVPLFPYGFSLATDILKNELFRTLQTVSISLPTDIKSIPNPFAQ
ncbi:MAG: hypothetical protein A3J48_00740 [Candidatus Doudnabacteria bacterium RIFCSPHIGHO2_02_FULL_46_11]|uniref:Pilus assembly protein PilO n=1 Tax=Candidatus Doudnabacteria bacterium RIFCSPHIGHO2_02_FULL_46_11 TaxID=1817832 RepID=A0A1F5P8G5_9BACT|nr:MAG: hypothetical protein A3J48_00740 [Candidatus Doudnabacteria bacterium RIFCSPHIGHO2_02_FULL_46_11]